MQTQSARPLAHTWYSSQVRECAMCHESSREMYPTACCILCMVHA